MLAAGGRVVRLTDAGVAALQSLLAGTASSPLARRLIDAGIAHPVAGPGTDMAITVVIPAHDRVEQLRRCLAACAGEHAIVVVDDGSRDAAAVAAVCASAGAALVRRETAGGPAAARNTGLAHVESELVAFLDSDCVPPPGWATRLSGHFRDPEVAAVAPRVRPAAGTGTRSPLDMGARPAQVAPGTRVPYVPTAALIGRRAALAGAGGGGVAAFDAGLRYGEDVDLVWRLVDRGWRVRYDPSVVVAHAEPRRLADRLVRRFRYGTSAAPLALRHPGRLAPVVLRPWPAAVAALLLARRPLPAALVAGVMAARLSSRVPRRLALRLTGQAVAMTLLGLGRAAATLAAPPVVIAVARAPRRRWPLLALLLAPAATERSAASLLDELAYGAGVWAGAIRHRTAGPLRPANGGR